MKRIFSLVALSLIAATSNANQLGTSSVPQLGTGIVPQRGGGVVPHKLRSDDHEAIPIHFLPGSDMLVIDDIGTAPRMAPDDWTTSPRVAHEDVESVPRYVLSNEFYGGARVSIGKTTIYYLSSDHIVELGQAAQSRTASAGKDTMSVSWFWDFDGKCVRVDVSLERNRGESATEFARRFADLVEAQMANYPPSCSHLPSPATARGMLGGVVGALMAPGEEVASMPRLQSAPSGEDGVMEVSWKRDTDGEGPLQPITVTARVEKREGESTRNAAKRLKYEVDALMDIFPPNVPVSPSTGALLLQPERWRAIGHARPMVA